MFRCSAKPFLAMFFILVDFVLISSASCAYDADAVAQQIVFSEDDLISEDQLPIMKHESRFIGDLEVGRRSPGDSFYNTSFKIHNTGPCVNTTIYYYTVPRGFIHYLLVANSPGSYAAICDFPDSLHGTRTYFSVRSPPYSVTTLNLLVAAC